MRGLIGALAAVWLGASGMVQAQAAGGDSGIAAAKNQLGVLEYCLAQGHVSGDVVARQAASFERLGAAGRSAAVERAYAKGKAGRISALGLEQSVAEAAAAQGLSLAQLCGQMAALAGR